VRRWKIPLIGGVAVVGVLLLQGVALAAGDPTGASKTPLPLGEGEQLVDRVLHNEVGLNLLWLVLGGALVVFMQAGFALVETGFTRAKHATHVVMTNFAVFGLGMIGYFSVGFALMFGAASAAVIGFAEPLGHPPDHRGDRLAVEIGPHNIDQIIASQRSPSSSGLPGP